MAALDARDGIWLWVPCYNQTTTEHERQATTKTTSRLFSHIFSPATGPDCPPMNYGTQNVNPPGLFRSWKAARDKHQIPSSQPQTEETISRHS